MITGEKRRFGRDMIVAFNYLKEGGNWNQVLDVAVGGGSGRGGEDGDQWLGEGIYKPWLNSAPPEGRR